MLEVRDQPAGQPGVRQGLAGHPRLPVMERPLRVEQVRHHPGARPGGGRDLTGARVGVADADQDARRGQAGNGAQGAGKLGSQRNDLQDPVARVEQLTDGRRRRIGHPVRVVRARPAAGR